MLKTQLSKIKSKFSLDNMAQYLISKEWRGAKICDSLLQYKNEEDLLYDLAFIEIEAEEMSYHRITYDTRN